MLPQANLHEMILEIELYHQMIQEETFQMAYHTNSFEDYIMKVPRIEQIVTEFLVLLKFFMEEVDDRKKEDKTNVLDMEVERYYRMAKETLAESGLFSHI